MKTKVMRPQKLLRQRFAKGDEQFYSPTGMSPVTNMQDEHGRVAALGTAAA